MIRLILGLFAGGSSLPWMIGGAVALIAGFFGWLAIHDHNLWNDATASFNKQQQEIVDKKKEEFNQKTQEIDDTAARIRAAIQQQEQINIDLTNNIEKNAIIENKGGTNPSSPYLKNIIKQLDQNYGMKK
ncbi:hypothetical protein UFOVP247_50 [uncultured Caudovirales phage]|uniref:Uncharacterized protein n=1 Tax=uncultured Caudovirales phage TaxID=2100421 RepID=A0A6J7WVM2_9CAUD|nr:hypothetical protein UFOVP247_50 [uncultured Caudovirales phage]